MDEEWRRAERAWRSTPDDPQAVETALRAARRARVPAPYDLFERERTPARSFTSKRPFVVLAETGPGEPVEVGATPGTVEVPACRTWWVRPEPAEATAVVVAELQREEVPGLLLGRSRADVASLALLAPLGAELRGLSLAACSNLDPVAVRELERLPCLETLVLSRASGLGRDALGGVARLGGLVRLGLSGVRELRDADLEPLVGLRALATLSLVRCLRLSDEALRTLARIPSLADLDLSGCEQTRDDGVRALARGCPDLRRLSLTNCDRIGAPALEALGGLPRLRDLGLHMCRGVTADALRTAACAPLERLNVDWICTNAHAAALEPLAGTLRELSASGNVMGGLHGDGFEALARLRRLERLDLSQVGGLTDAALAPLARLDRLSELTLNHTSLDGQGLRALAGLPLRALGLRGLPRLRAVDELPPSLERLLLSGGRALVVDDLVPAVGRLPGLRELELAQARGLTEVGVARLPRTLRSLALSFGEMDDAALEPLLRLPDLERLDLEGCPRLTRAGVSALVRALALRWLRASEALVDDGTRQALRERGCALDLV